ncbi:hypothetical protein GCM10023084_21680 [Streptomyces lacrimifluminis]|uniref:Uncharacterized protein n=1 Tax=Streptomyces lacrimifluminis TaxID=1500077 RepID=A0A917NWW5_9ACTN|nr:hypothetical protein [Streptomyces lacrimifluminis]GGJ35957.1 hypothetical protein GCM10012282_35890 [Streptomyces lacrimifluminis]
MTPYSLAFYMDVVTTGTVFGVSHADSPEHVAKVLGPDVAEGFLNDHTMCLGYGFAEFFWDRASPDQPWSGHHFTLQVHRLARRDRSDVHDVFRARYGRFTPRLRFEKLRRLLARRGVPLLEIPPVPGFGPYFRTFWQPESRVAVTVIGTYGEYQTPDNLRVGDVYSVHGPLTTREVEWRRAEAGQQGHAAPPSGEITPLAPPTAS